MEIVISDTENFNTFADGYKTKKRQSLVNLIECGKIIYQCREILSHNQFLEWLKDHRVNESERTAARLMQVFGDYGHMLDTNKIEIIGELGMTHLLELKKLPDRFKKDIEIIHHTPEGDKTEVRTVIDEDKLSDFLEQPVETKEGLKKVHDLSLSEMRKVINEASGVYEPESFFEDEDIADAPKEKYHAPLLDGGNLSDNTNQAKKLFEEMTTLVTLSHAINASSVKIDEAYMVIMPEDEKEMLSDEIDKVLSVSETMYIRLKELKSRMG
jgi:hypothetical protein